MGGGGTEAFEGLGRHCKQEDCRQLDFLPFTCDGCLKVFCLEHRTYAGHGCPKADHRNRTVAVCRRCSAAVEKNDSDGGTESDADALRRHAASGSCDPATAAEKKRRLRCPAAGCRAQLTASNATACRSCRQRLCLKHRFPDAHACAPPPSSAAARDTKFLLAFEGRMNSRNCGRENHLQSSSKPPPPLTEEAC